MNHIETIYGEVKQIGDAGIILAAPRDAPDGIGCALGLMPWDGRYTVIETERLEAWRPEPWADFWLMFPLNVGALYPLGYFRCTNTRDEWGEVKGGKPEDQIVLGSFARPVAPGRQRSLRISATDNTIHIGRGEDTLSLRICHTGRLGLYCEASIVKVRVTQGGR